MIKGGMQLVDKGLSILVQHVGDCGSLFYRNDIIKLNIKHIKTFDGIEWFKNGEYLWIQTKKTAQGYL
jgi:hypothetical protein